MHQAKAILANPEQDSGQHVRERYLAHLSQMHDKLARLLPLASPFEHFCHITDNFASGLFQCSDVEGLPRTNNELEHCFGVARVLERPATGRRGDSWGGGPWVCSRDGRCDQQTAALLGRGTATLGLSVLARPAAAVTASGGIPPTAMALVA